MRVQVSLELSSSDEQIEIPWKSADPAAGYMDLRESPAGLAGIEAARRHRPLHNLLAALNSADSVFSSVRSKAWLNPDDPQGGREPSEFASRVEVVFAADELNFGRTQYEDLAQRLLELLTRDSGDALRARLCVRRCQFHGPGREGFGLTIFLYARGETPGQAELRWGLGVARVQQALLFLSRVIRHHLAHPA